MAEFLSLNEAVRKNLNEGEEFIDKPLLYAKPISKWILPNKVFEYSLLKKPFIMTDFNRDLNTLHHSILIANNHKQFKDFVKQQMVNPYDTKELQNFTFDYRWDKISEKYKKFLISSLKK